MTAARRLAADTWMLAAVATLAAAFAITILLRLATVVTLPLDVAPTSTSSTALWPDPPGPRLDQP